MVSELETVGAKEANTKSSSVPYGDSPAMGIQVLGWVLKDCQACPFIRPHLYVLETISVT